MAPAMQPAIHLFNWPFSQMPFSDWSPRDIKPLLIFLSPMGDSPQALTRLGSFSMTSWMEAPRRQQTFLEIFFGWQMGTSVPFSKKFQITNTLCSFLVALVLMWVRSWTNFTQLDFPGSCPLLLLSFFSSPRASYLLCGGSLGGRGGFLLL